MFNVRKLTLVLFAALSLLGLAVPATAGEQVPLKGTLEGQIISATPLDASHLGLSVVVSGQATHLGRFTGQVQVIQNVADGTFIGTFTWTAANGDTIFGTFFGQLVPTQTPGLFYNITYSTITGGTGRFAGATGSMIEAGYVDQSTGVFVHPFEGTISTVGSKKK